MKRRNQKNILGLTSLRKKKKSSRTLRQKHTKRLPKVGELGNGWQASRSSVSSSLLNRGIRGVRLQAGKEAADLLVSVGATHGAKGIRVQLPVPRAETWTLGRQRPIVKTADKLDTGKGTHSALR